MMTIRLIILLMIAGLGACSSGPKPIDYGKEECVFCKMTIMDKQFGCQVVNTKGKPFNFDDVSCLVSYLVTTKPEEIGAIYVPEYTGMNELLPAAEMHFVKSELLHSPMAGNTAGFSVKDSALQYADKFQGNMVTWENIISRDE